MSKESNGAANLRVVESTCEDCVNLLRVAEVMRCEHVRVAEIEVVND